nr:PD-(D/E)XK motif protein [Pseudonocardia sp. EC080625-04]
MTPHGPVLVAVREDDVRHLLVPIDARHSLKEDVDGRSVTLRRRVLEDESSYRTYAALALVDDGPGDLFRALCVEVLARIEADPDRAVAALRRTLTDWRALLSGARRTLGPAELAGLFGELLLLSEMLDDDPGAVAFWTGHSGSAQDFHRSAIALEVKATTAAEGRKVRIHGVGQLDGGDAMRLLLTWVRLRTDRGRSVPDLVDACLARTDDEGALLTALRDAGYLPADRAVYAGKVFDVVERRTFEVGPGFPRITASGLAGDATLAGIGGVHYDLDLDTATATDTIIDGDAARAFLEHS